MLSLDFFYIAFCKFYQIWKNIKTLNIELLFVVRWHHSPCKNDCNRGRILDLCFNVRQTRWFFYHNLALSRLTVRVLTNSIRCPFTSNCLKNQIILLFVRCCYSWIQRLPLQPYCEVNSWCCRPNEKSCIQIEVCVRRKSIAENCATRRQQRLPGVFFLLIVHVKCCKVEITNKRTWIIILIITKLVNQNKYKIKLIGLAKTTSLYLS